MKDYNDGEGVNTGWHNTLTGEVRKLQSMSSLKSILSTKLKLLIFFWNTDRFCHPSGLFYLSSLRKKKTILNIGKQEREILLATRDALSLMITPS